MISRQITTRTLFYVMICHLYGKCRYEKISCYFISCTFMFKKCKKLVYMNEYGTECKTDISAYGFWPNKSIIWYFIHECLFRSMNGMHRTVSYLSNLTWIKILIIENVWLFIRLRFTGTAVLRYGPQPVTLRFTHDGSHSGTAVLRYGPQPVTLRFTHAFLTRPRAWKQNRVGAI